MTDPCAWPALAEAAAPPWEPLRPDLGIWGKVHGQASDYRWIARSAGFAGPADLHRHLRLGGEDLAVRATAWRAPWQADAMDYWAVGLYPSRAHDAAGRAAVLEKRVLRWRRPAGVPAALGALTLLPVAAAGDDRLWWGRVGEGDWQRPDYALPLGPEACPVVELGPEGLADAIEAGIVALTAALDEARLAALYAGLLGGRRPVLLDGQGGPLSPVALAALLLPLAPGEAARCSLCGWVPATLVDPQDLARNWDLAVTGQTGSAAPSPERSGRAARMASALVGREPGALRPRAVSPRAAGARPPRPGVDGTGPLHPVPRFGLGSPARPGLDYLYRFADALQLRRLDLSALARDLDGRDHYPGLAPGEDPAGHPIVGWIAALEGQCPAGVDAADWSWKIDQLRAAAVLLLPHPRTLDLVGLPRDPRVPALLAVLAVPPGRLGDQILDQLAGHGEASLRRLWAQTRDCPGGALLAEIQARAGRCELEADH